ncbi:hypothetical protein F2Q69_00018651 [Brassica cretica]|uniref:Myb-like domain-containing protein n=1 Tax=Brassica cretica TaxID=69181 RepID=A0A8S9QKT7_BRACR|nr:hypothetical protein F2Q69_00018651 [Brassica cretica]
MRLLVPFPLSSVSPLSPGSPLSPLSHVSPLYPLSPMSPLSPLSPLSLTSKMDFNPFQDSTNFVELLHSQQNVIFGSQGRVPLSSSQVSSFGSEVAELPAECKERRTWTVTEDIVLISTWLKTSKGPVVGNEQKSATFWTRVAAYFSASPKLAGYEKRDGNQCKQHWHKLNEAVCKFSGAYEAATREKTSGMSDNECSRYHIAVEDSSITGHSIILFDVLYQFVGLFGVSRVVQCVTVLKSCSESVV